MKTTLTLQSETAEDEEKMESVLRAEDYRFALREILEILTKAYVDRSPQEKSFRECGEVLKKLGIGEL